MSFSFHQAYEYLSRRPAGGQKWSLGPTQGLLDSLGSPQREFPCIHVGGSNGKGSVCALLYRALSDRGLRVGLYTSPHLVAVEERVVVAGRPITREAFAHWTNSLRPAIERRQASFFEATTAIALADFAARHVDVAVIEVGLGGRLDATNVVSPLVSAVTSISMEHTDYLGSSLQSIAREKAGIAKAGIPFVIGDTNEAIAAELAAIGARAGAIPMRVAVEDTWKGQMALRGPHQRRNAAIARVILDQLPTELRVTREGIEHAFALATIPGRYDHRGKWLFDVAHNPAGVETLISTMAEDSLTSPVHGVVSLLKDKDWQAFIRCLHPVLDGLWVTVAPSAPVERRWDLREVRERLDPGVHVVEDFGAALAAAEVGAGTVLVTGSFHTVGDAMARLPGFAPLG